MRRKRMRSYRDVKHFLWAFSIAGFVIGCGLMGWFGLHGHWQLAKVGLVYVLISALLFGIRGIIEHKDAERKRRRNIRHAPRSSS